MSVSIRRLHFKVGDFIGQLISNGTAKTKFAILAFLYCGEFVKNSNVGRKNA